MSCTSIKHNQAWFPSEIGWGRIHQEQFHQTARSIARGHTHDTGSVSSSSDASSSWPR